VGELIVPETTHIMPMRSFVRRTPPARVWVLREEASELVHKRATQKILIIIKGMNGRSSGEMRQTDSIQ
jgi:hypothetical protein